MFPCIHVFPHSVILISTRQGGGVSVRTRCYVQSPWRVQGEVKPTTEQHCKTQRTQFLSAHSKRCQQRDGRTSITQTCIVETNICLLVLQHYSSSCSSIHAERSARPSACRDLAQRILLDTASTTRGNLMTRSTRARWYGSQEPGCRRWPDPLATLEWHFGNNGTAVHHYLAQFEGRHKQLTSLRVRVQEPALRWR